MKNKKTVLISSAALLAGLTVGTFLLAGLNKASTAIEASPTPAVRSCNGSGGCGGSCGRADGVKKSCGCSQETKDAIQKAVENNDYETWKKLRAETATNRAGKKSEQWDRLIDSKEKFEKFVNMQKLMDQGKYEEANAIKLELGFQMGTGQGFGKGRNR